MFSDGVKAFIAKRKAEDLQNYTLLAKQPNVYVVFSLEHMGEDGKPYEDATDMLNDVEIWKSTVKRAVDVDPREVSYSATTGRPSLTHQLTSALDGVFSHMFGLSQHESFSGPDLAEYRALHQLGMVVLTAHGLPRGDAENLRTQAPKFASAHPIFDLLRDQTVARDYIQKWTQFFSEHNRQIIGGELEFHQHGFCGADSIVQLWIDKLDRDEQYQNKTLLLVYDSCYAGLVESHLHEIKGLQDVLHRHKSRLIVQTSCGNEPAVGGLFAPCFFAIQDADVRERLLASWRDSGCCDPPFPLQAPQCFTWGVREDSLPLFDCTVDKQHIYLFRSPAFFKFVWFALWQTGFVGIPSVFRSRGRHRDDNAKPNTPRNPELWWSTVAPPIPEDYGIFLQRDSFNIIGFKGLTHNYAGVENVFAIFLVAIDDASTRAFAVHIHFNISITAAEANPGVFPELVNVTRVNLVHTRRSKDEWQTLLRDGDRARLLSHDILYDKTKHERFDRALKDPMPLALYKSCAEYFGRLVSLQLITGKWWEQHAGDYGIAYEVVNGVPTKVATEVPFRSTSFEVQVEAAKQGAVRAKPLDFAAYVQFRVGATSGAT